MADVLTHDDAKTLLTLCREGKLYEVETWIAAGKTLAIPSDLRKTALSVAIDTGFHSLVVLLARHESQEAKNRALQDATRRRRRAYMEVLLAHGADLNSVPLSTALESWDPKTIRFFLDSGVDPITDDPFAEAFCSRIRTALRPFVEYKKMHPEFSAQLQEQADQALRYHAAKGDLKWVSLLMWAGADPRSRGRRPDEADDEELHVTALEEACYQEKVDVLKRLRPDPVRDNLPALLRCAALLARIDIVQYLLELGASPNDKSNGGSTPLETCLAHLSLDDIESVLYRRPISRWGVYRTMDCLKTLLSHGARFLPDDRHMVTDLRRTLTKAEPDLAVDLFKLLLQYRACERDLLQQVLNTPRIKQHLASREEQLERLNLFLKSPREIARQTQQRERQRVEDEMRNLMLRYDRNKLYEEAWQEPMRHVAKRYNVADVFLGKVCRKLRIPVPGRGYWAKKAAGKPVPRRPQMADLDIARNSVTKDPRR